MRTLSGRKIRVIRQATMRDAYYLNGSEITRDEATKLAMEHCNVESLNQVMRAVQFRDCTPVSNPIQTARGVYWHALVSLA